MTSDDNDAVIEVEDTRHLLDLLALDDIYYLRLNVDRVNNSDDAEVADGPRLDHEIFSRHGDRNMSVRLRTTVEAVDAVYQVDVVTDYASMQPFVASESVRQDFIERVAIMAAWPYLRMAVSDLSSRMRAEQITLGLYRVGDINLGDPTPADPITGVPLEREG
jgi:hypothetical protein